MRCAVVIPTHKPEPDAFERVSFDQCARTLGGHDIFMAVPEHIDPGYYTARAPGVRVMALPSGYFTSIDAYNRLLLSTEIYDRLRGYDYVLIHELDAFVFSDELGAWAARGHDYVGAPWVGVEWVAGALADVRTAHNPVIRAAKRALAALNGRDVHVGNGGLSLRRVRTFRALTRALPYLVPGTRRYPLHDDMVWGLFVKTYLPFFDVAPFAVARQFSIESDPACCMALNGGRLPFGTHAWYKEAREFWRPHVERAGYEIARG
jgi:hypothetical protein